VLGLIPYFRHIELDSEDALPLETVFDPQFNAHCGVVKIAVLFLPHISNFTDVAPLSRDKQVTVHYLSKPRSLESYHLLIIPGSKSVR
jgi:adenosylcobyric acid synthase